MRTQKTREIREGFISAHWKRQRAPEYVSVALTGRLFTSLWLLYCSNNKDERGRKCNHPPNPNYSLPDFSQETLVVHPCCSPRTHHTKKPSVSDFKYLPEAQMEQYQAASAALPHTDLCLILDLRSCLDVGQESSSITFRWG